MTFEKLKLENKSGVFVKFYTFREKIIAVGIILDCESLPKKNTLL